MCLPVVAAAVVASTAAAGVAKTYGNYQAATAQANMYGWQAQASQIQSQLIKNTGEANITYTQDAAARNATMLRRTQAETTGAAQASVGAQGLGSSGTAVDVLQDIKSKQEMDQETLQYNANVKAWNITNQMNNQVWAQDNQTAQDLAAQSNTLKARSIGLTTDLLSTAASTATSAFMAGGGFGGGSGAGVSSGSGDFASGYSGDSSEIY
jgi:hypothetical protein